MAAPKANTKGKVSDFDLYKHTDTKAVTKTSVVFRFHSWPQKLADLFVIYS